MEKIQKLGIVINGTKLGAAKLGQTIAQSAEALGVKVALTESYPVESGFLKGMDACCVLGGDGTILGVVPESLAHKVPVFGVNQGKLGFLATFSDQEILEQLEQLLLGDYQIVKRSVIECTTGNGQKGIALNDVVIKSESISRLICLKVYNKEEWVTEYYSDGLIFCTPTGSTAYNLSAGGPIVTPGAGIMTMTPICPHTLTNRSVVFGNDCELTVDQDNCEASAHLSLDGQAHAIDCSLFPLKLKVCRSSLALLQPLDYSYYSLLRKKLKWGSQ